ncbi:MAG: hypothetical protein CR988_05410 [Treponema sp.]|nr:MAG: hypothetical protein CR988_05410 [Treponema sp.]
MKKIVCILFGLFVLSGAVTAQDDSEDMMTVEEAYLNTVEGVVINEMLKTDGRDSKFVALQYIEEAIENGRDSEDIQKALGKLATIGLSTTVLENGRVANNYPDVRIKACELLGKSKNKEAKYALKQVMFMDNEPSVITSAVKALGEIGFDENDEEILETINWVNQKFDICNPTSSLALALLNTYEKIAPNVKNRKSLIEGVMRIASNYSYVTPVRNRAKEVLSSIAGLGGSSKKSKKGK